ncbi:MAG: ChaN family lipoprotein [Crocinitomicaceae bacterium]
MKIFLLIFTLATAGSLYSQEKAFQIYTSTGKKTTYKKMMATLEKKDIVLFGEEHNNPIAHWLQLEFTKQADNSRDIVLGAEMFEADNQQALNDYLAGKLTSKELDSLARLWPNYPTDYAPLVDYAKENKLEFIATNIPRRDANLVFRKGFEVLDTLSAEEKSWIAPLPIKFDAELPQYKNILVMMGEHGSPKLVMAQATKDATMAHFILKNYKPGSLFIHFNGKYHSDFYEGILWYLQQAQPTLNYGTISTVSQVSIDKLEKENIGAADFIICVPEDMTKTH